MRQEPVVYADSSALTKLVVAEAESSALRQFLSGEPRLVTSAIARVEVLRALGRAAAPGAAVDAADEMFSRLYLGRVSDEILARAARLVPWTLRALDCVHLATALEVAPPPAAFLCYDLRLAAAARDLGLAVVAPGIDEVHEGG